MLERIRKIFNRHINTREINYKTAQKMMQEKHAILLDVRSKQEYEEGHLMGAICISLYSLEKEIQHIIPNKTTNIIVYCSSGIRSKQAQEILESIAYENVYNLKGGLNNI